MSGSSEEEDNVQPDIILEGLEKKFGKNMALDGISLEVGRGELFGLIGPDGAGKTTMIRILVGLVLADGGKAFVNGHNVSQDLRPVKEIIGYLSQQFSLYSDLTVRENIRFYGDLYQIPRDEIRRREADLLEFSRLKDFALRRAGALSGGMKQKLALCCTLIHVPRVLLLDEPTTGVDPVSRREFWNLLDSLRKEGTTIFVSTAYMEEASRCDRVALIYLGRLLAADTPARLQNRYPYTLLEVVLPEAVTLAEEIERLPEVRSVQVFGDRLHLGVEDEHTAVDKLKEVLYGRQRELKLKRIEPGMEDVFVEMIG